MPKRCDVARWTKKKITGTRYELMGTRSDAEIRRFPFQFVVILNYQRVTIRVQNVEVDICAKNVNYEFFLFQRPLERFCNT